MDSSEPPLNFNLQQPGGAELNQPVAEQPQNPTAASQDDDPSMDPKEKKRREKEENDRIKKEKKEIERKLKEEKNLEKKQKQAEQKAQKEAAKKAKEAAKQEAQLEKEAEPSDVPSAPASDEPTPATEEPAPKKKKEKSKKPRPPAAEKPATPPGGKQSPSPKERANEFLNNFRTKHAKPNKHCRSGNVFIFFGMSLFLIGILITALGNAFHLKLGEWGQGKPILLARVTGPCLILVGGVSIIYKILYRVFLSDWEPDSLFVRKEPEFVRIQEQESQPPPPYTADVPQVQVVSSVPSGPVPKTTDSGSQGSGDSSITPTKTAPGDDSAESLTTQQAGGNTQQAGSTANLLTASQQGLADSQQERRKKCVIQ